MQRHVAVVAQLADGGSRSQWLSPMSTTASASRPHSSQRSPVRARTSTTRRSRGRSRRGRRPSGGAASRSSRNFGNGSRRQWDVAADDRVAGWASGQSHSMIRSKNTRSIRSRWRCVFAVRPSPHARLSDRQVLNVTAADVGDGTDVAVLEQPAGELAQRPIGKLDAVRSEERRRLRQVSAQRVRDLWGQGGDLRPVQAAFEEVT